MNQDRLSNNSVNLEIEPTASSITSNQELTICDEGLLGVLFVGVVTLLRFRLLYRKFFDRSATASSSASNP